MKYFMLTMLTLSLALSACAHKARLLTPSQIAKAERAEAKREIRDAQRKENIAKREAERAEELKQNPETSDEVTIPARLF